MAKANLIKEGVDGILKQYAFEFATPTMRKKLCYEIGRYLNEEIIDRTTDEMVDNHTFNLTVKINDKEYPLMKYIDEIELIERKNKLLKIKRMIWLQKVKKYS